MPYIDVFQLMEYANNTANKSIDANDIARFPWSDVVEVVRCKDCKWYNDYEVECSLPIGLVYPNSDDYCSKGERKEMDNED